MEPTRQPVVPQSKFGMDDAEHLRRVIQAVSGLQNGKGNNHYVCTLTPNSIETLCLIATANIGSVAVLTPRSESAAAAITVVWHEVVKDYVVIHHDSQPATDREFGIILHG